MIDKKKHKNSGNWWDKVQLSSLKCGNSYSNGGATELFLETTRMATHMMENKNNKIKLQLIYKYQCLSYCLLSRSILGCFAFIRLWGAPWWTFNLYVHFDHISKYLVYFAYHLSPRRNYKLARPPGQFTSTHYFAVNWQGGRAGL